VPAAAKPRVGLRTLVTALQRHDAETGQAWDAIVHFAGRRGKLREHKQAAVLGQEPPVSSAIAEGFAAVTAQLKEIDGSIDTLLAMEKAEEQPVAVVEAVVAVPPPAAKPTRRKVVEATPPAEPVNEGPAPPSPVAVPPPPGPVRRQLTELSDDELLERIEHLDRAIDRARTVLIRRYAEVEKDLAVLAPPKKQAAAAKPVVRRRPQKKSPTTMSPDQVKALQSALNACTGKRLKNVAPIVVDGVKGKATIKRIREAKNYLGYAGKERNSAKIDKEFVQRLKHPARHSNPRMLSRALRRRRQQKKAAKLSLAPRNGVATFDGRPVAAWMQPYLVWARNNGWKGTLNSGWRDPAHSEHLCLQMCGRPSCPGKCAGRSSNHAGSVKPAGAVDVSDYVTFGHLMARCPYSPKLVNRLGARDPVHYSVSGG